MRNNNPNQAPVTLTKRGKAVLAAAALTLGVGVAAEGVNAAKPDKVDLPNMAQANDHIKVVYIGDKYDTNYDGKVAFDKKGNDSDETINTLYDLARFAYPDKNPNDIAAEIAQQEHLEPGNLKPGQPVVLGPDAQIGWGAAIDDNHEITFG